MTEDIIKKFIEGKCTPGEVNAILKWYHSSDAREYYYSEIDKAASSYKEGKSIRNFDKELVLQKLVARIKYEGKSPSMNLQKTSRPGIFYHASRIAASLILFMSLALFIYQNIGGMPDKALPAMQMVSKRTSSGQKSTIFLNDGSRIILNSTSEITYPDYFSDSCREIWLKGEAFIQVAKDEKRPFAIHTGRVTTIALGTSFNIRAYDHEPEIQVVLNTGKIKITDHKQNTSIIDEPNKGIVFNHETEEWKNERFDPKSVFLWKDGILYFKNASFQEMIGRFETWYGVSFHVENYQKAEDKLFTAEFDNESLHNVLTGLSFSKEFEFQIKNDQVYIKFNK